MILPHNHVSPAWHQCILSASPASPRLKKVKSQVPNAILALQSESTLVIGINITTMYIFMNIYVVMYIPITRVCMHACSPVKRDSTSHLLYEFQVSEHITCMDS